MEFITFIIALIIGAVLGAAIGVLVMKLRSAKDIVAAAEALAASKAEAAAELAKNQAEAASAIAKSQAESENLRQLLAETKEESEKSRKEALETQQKHFNETIEKVKAEMRVATEQMLKDRQKDFTESSGQNLDQILKPLKDSIATMKKTMEESTLKQAELGSSLSENIKNAMRFSENAKTSADELSNALKLKNKAMGNWGEMLLDNLLASLGLTKGVHYDTQAKICDADGKTVRSEDNKSLIPDVILHLDQNREVIIDSKVSLKAFVDYANAESNTEREKALGELIASIESHVSELSKKDYSKYIKPPKVKMDYVIMFVPHYAALWTALNAKPGLWQDAMEKNVYIADEQTLYAALRIIKMTWTQIVQNEKYEKVFELANTMVERVGMFMEFYKNIGDSLDKAKTAFDKGYGKLQPGGQSILTTCGELIKIGARQSAKHKIPELAGTDMIQLPLSEESLSKEENGNSL